MPSNNAIRSNALELPVAFGSRLTASGSRLTASGSRLTAAGRIGLAVLTIAAATTGLDAQQLERGTKAHAPRFYADDPMWTDADMRDIPPVAEFDLSKSYEFVIESFAGTAKSFGPA